MSMWLLLIEWNVVLIVVEEVIYLYICSLCRHCALADASRSNVRSITFS